MKDRKRFIINGILITLFACVSVYFSIKDEYKDIGKALMNTKWYSLLFLIFISVLVYIIEGIILTILSRIHSKEITVFKGVKASLIGAFFGGITPFASGCQLAQGYTFIKMGMNLTASISVLLMNFFIYQTTLVLYMGVVLIVKYHD